MHSRACKTHVSQRPGGYPVMPPIYGDFHGCLVGIIGYLRIRYLGVLENAVYPLNCCFHGWNELKWWYPWIWGRTSWRFQILFSIPTFSRTRPTDHQWSPGGPDLQVDWIFFQAAARCREVGLAERQDEFHEFLPCLGCTQMMAKTSGKMTQWPRKDRLFSGDPIMWKLYWLKPHPRVSWWTHD